MVTKAYLEPFAQVSLNASTFAVLYEYVAPDSS